MNRKQREVWDAVVLRDRGICQDCGSPGMEVHHIVGRGYHKKRPELIWRKENMMCACKQCHDGARNQRARFRHLNILMDRYGYVYREEPWTEILRRGLEWKEYLSSI